VVVLPLPPTAEEETEIVIKRVQSIGTGLSLPEKRALEEGTIVHPGLCRAGHAEQQQRAISGERSNRGFDQPAIADIFGADWSPVARFPAHQIGHHRLRRELPVRRAWEIIAAAEGGKFVGVGLFGDNAESCGCHVHPLSLGGRRIEKHQAIEEKQWPRHPVGGQRGECDTHLRSQWRRRERGNRETNKPEYAWHGSRVCQHRERLRPQ
jgi:hypothetical protein